MKIKIRSEEKNLNLVFPTRLLLNRFTASIGAKAINEKAEIEDVKVDAKDLRKFFEEIYRIKLKHPNLVLLDVESADGETVKISL